MEQMASSGFENNNNTSSNFLDLTDTIEIKGLSDVKSKREKLIRKNSVE